MNLSQNRRSSQRTGETCLEEGRGVRENRISHVVRGGRGRGRNAKCGVFSHVHIIFGNFFYFSSFFRPLTRTLRMLCPLILVVNRLHRLSVRTMLSLSPLEATTPSRLLTCPLLSSRRESTLSTRLLVDPPVSSRPPWNSSLVLTVSTTLPPMLVSSVPVKSLVKSLVRSLARSLARSPARSPAKEVMRRMMTPSLSLSTSRRVFLSARTAKWQFQSPIIVTGERDCRRRVSNETLSCRERVKSKM